MLAADSRRAGSAAAARGPDGPASGALIPSTSARPKRQAGKSSSSITRSRPFGGAGARRAGHDETIFRVSGSLEDGTHEFSFPIDSTVESAFISVSLQCLQVVEIATPAGALLRDSDPGVDYHQFQAGRIVTIKKPAPGPWKVTVSGKGMFFLVAQAKSDLSLDDARFVSKAGGRARGVVSDQGATAPLACSRCWRCA